MNENDEITTPLADAVASLHELFTECREQGFSEMQALYMLGVMLASAFKEEEDQ